MPQFGTEVRFRTRGEVEVRDLTPEVERAVRASGVTTGQALVFTTSSNKRVPSGRSVFGGRREPKTYQSRS